ncbi:karyopherin [Schizosaccharomyces japonicus yFS275]|uniref:Karyopherin n=1 Tax=Schizosaccharomyces japonicus (strain yFS275 / FY16936) TaxID=402676 RepID=B6K4B6_SCHJY|nr:karyopherin [Schizosaccharomyces japonicus yFS275]EEB08323.1 karyopherin [Schizosaccharomyces japonicus yFS275]
MDTLVNALQTLYSNSDRAQKVEANAYLEEFQKSTAGWDVSVNILRQPDASIEAKLFAAQTIRQKIIYDFHQLPKEAHEELRSTLLTIYVSARDSPRPLLVSLSVCVAALALHMLDWHNVLDDVFQACMSDTSGKCMLQFLAVLPEEAGDPRKTSLPWEELCQRIDELLRNNGDAVLRLLLQYVTNLQMQTGKPLHSELSLVLSALNSWLREIPMADVLTSPLCDLAFNSITDDFLTDAAVELVCSMLFETKEVDECIESINILYPKVVALQPRLQEARDDPLLFRSLGRVFAEAGDSWVVLVARSPADFIGLVQCIANISAWDEELETVKFTFSFWWNLKQLLELDAYANARQQFAPIYLELLGSILQHLHYPIVDDFTENNALGNKEVLFDDRDAEDRFRSFRHEMGDVLKDCCIVAGVEPCLTKVAAELLDSLQKKEKGLPFVWQNIEASLFALRAMGRMVPPTENTVLPNIIKLLPSLPENNKIRYACTLFLGRYTEWTAQHGEYLEFQLNYISSGFSVQCTEVRNAAAQALKHFCQDCRTHLVYYLDQLHTFYLNISPALDTDALMEVTEGIANIINVQPLDKIFEALHNCIAPILQTIVTLETKTTHSKAELESFADNIDMLTIFFTEVNQPCSPTVEHPTVKLFQNIWVILSRILDSTHDILVCERLCKLYKNFLYTFPDHSLVALPAIAEQLVKGFNDTHYGCFLWVSGVCVRQFGRPEVDSFTTNSIWQFVEVQCLHMFEFLSSKDPKDIPDVIDDFFRLLMDAFLANPNKVIASNMFPHILQAILVSLQLSQYEPLRSVLSFLQDMVAFATGNAPFSLSEPLSDTCLARLCDELMQHSQQLFVLLFNGMAFLYPQDNIPDASATLLPLIRLLCSKSIEACAATMAHVLSLLPPTTISDAERQKFMESFTQYCTASHFPRLRAHLQDWTAMYRRRVLTPRNKSLPMGPEDAKQ